MFNKYKIIIDAGKTKRKVFLFFDMKESGIIFGTSMITILLFQGALGQIGAFALGLAVGVCLGALFLPLTNGLNLWENLKLMISYYFKEPNAYYYYLEEDSGINQNFNNESEVKKRGKRKKTKKAKKQDERKGFSY